MHLEGTKVIEDLYSTLHINLTRQNVTSQRSLCVQAPFVGPKVWALKRLRTSRSIYLLAQSFRDGDDMAATLRPIFETCTPEMKSYTDN